MIYLVFRDFSLLGVYMHVHLCFTIWCSAYLICYINCDQVVNRQDGCDMMVCGTDAPDKGGGNKQESHNCIMIDILSFT